MSDEFFMYQAIALAEQALAAGEFPVGCVMVSDNQVVATGARRGSTGTSINEIDHAEMVALRQLYKHPRGRDPGKTTVYCTLEPCLMCFGALVIAGIGKIVYAYEDVMGGGTGCHLESLPGLYKKNRPLVIPHMLREKSLALFQAFFNGSGSSYLKDTLLADYTCRQSITMSRAASE